MPPLVLSAHRTTPSAWSRSTTAGSTPSRRARNSASRGPSSDIVRVRPPCDALGAGLESTMNNIDSSTTGEFDTSQEGELMKIPERAPDAKLSSAFVADLPGVAAKLGDVVRKAQGDYLYWDRFKQLTMPPG